VFPEVACEDLGFTMLAASAGLEGRFAHEPTGFEAFPKTYSALRAKYRRIIAGTIDCFRLYGVRLWSSPHVSLVEKLDFMMTFSTCYLHLVAMVNVAGALALGWFQEMSGHAQPLGWLLTVYLVGPLTPLLPLISQAVSKPRRMGRFAILASVAYASMTPLLAAGSFTTRVRFPGHSDARTPKTCPGIF